MCGFIPFSKTLMFAIDIVLLFLHIWFKCIAKGVSFFVIPSQKKIEGDASF